MADFKEVPVVDVHVDNIDDLWPSLTLAIQNATFAGIDLELSGLGDRRKINARDVEDRYQAMKEVSMTRSIVSVGLSFFKLLQDSGQALQFHVQTFNILLLCSENYVVEPLSLTFLVEHGFDFNRQYSKGLPYCRGKDKPQEKSTTIRKLLSEMIRVGTPIVFHNALVDLVFLYQNFYTDLPAAMPAFLADMADMFTGGIYDTKYITEFFARFPASYLEYTFRRNQRENFARVGDDNTRHVSLSFSQYPSQCPYVQMLQCGLDTISMDSYQGKSRVCENFAAYGWCRANRHCPESHDIDLILDRESYVLQKKCKKREKKRRKRNSSHTSDDAPDAEMETEISSSTRTSESLNENSEVPNQNEPPVQTKTDPNGMSVLKAECRSGGHRAGFDAFMTAFTFASYITQFGMKAPARGLEKADEEVEAGKEIKSFKDFGMAAHANKVTLCGKNMPLLVAQSAFSKTSIGHREKIALIRDPVSQ